MIDRRVACALITGYQRYLSPHKGFHCAHRLLHGGESCSAYIKGSIRELGLLAAIKPSMQRFQACKLAAGILRQQAQRQFVWGLQKRRNRFSECIGECLPDIACHGAECGAESCLEGCSESACGWCWFP